MRKRDELTNPNSCMSRANDDEWTFVLLGRDAAAPVAIRAWAFERVRLGKNQMRDAQIVEALECAAAMEGRCQCGHRKAVHFGAICELCLSDDGYPEAAHSYIPIFEG